MGKVVLLTLLVLVGVVVCRVAQDKVSPRIQTLLQQQQQQHTKKSANDPVHLWVYFSDKGVQGSEERRREARGQLHPRAVTRRAKRSEGKEWADEDDFPVNAHYISQVEAAGVQVRRSSKWLNSVSLILNYIFILYVYLFARPHFYSSFFIHFYSLFLFPFLYCLLFYILCIKYINLLWFLLLLNSMFSPFPIFFSYSFNPIFLIKGRFLLLFLQ